MRRRHIITAIIVIAFVAIFLARSLIGKQPEKIYFVPLGEFSSRSLEELVMYYDQKYRLAIETLPAMTLEPWVTDYTRRQLIAEELIERMKHHYPQLAKDPTVILIGITSKDMFIRNYKWQFAFSWRQEGRFAVVSSARMDPVFFGRRPNPDLLQSRLRKMITKNIGLMYYGHSQSSDPKSVLYRSVLSIDDLDKIGEDF